MVDHLQSILEIISTYNDQADAVCLKSMRTESTVLLTTYVQDADKLDMTYKISLIPSSFQTIHYATAQNFT